MGALHLGHSSLIERSLKENDLTIVSIFVNPTQFDNKNDLNNYPSSIEQDFTLLKNLGVDAVFLPFKSEIYSDNYRYNIAENNFSNKLCGKTRPAHFDGVLTVVMKLFNLIDPKRAYFGEKDYQQLELIKDMVSSFFMDIEIVPCPIIRDEFGLALSSRNKYLSGDEQKFIANHFSKNLKSANSLKELASELEDLNIKIDYLEEHSERRFGAIHFGDTRLIDNVRI